MLNLIRSVCASRRVSGMIVKRITENGIAERISGARSFCSSYDNKWPNKRQPNPNVKRTSGMENPKITLLTSDSMPVVIMLEQARRIAMRRELKLVKIIDADQRTQRPVYRLMTGAEYYKEDLKGRKVKSAKNNADTKDPKLVVLSHKISDHDLASKVKNIIKWLNKRHEVRIRIIAPDNNETADRIYTTIEAETKHAGLSVQKRFKGDDLKFQLVPLKRLKPDSAGNCPQETVEETTYRESP